MKETLKRRVKALSLVLLVVLLTVTMLPTTAFAASKKVPSKVSVTKVSASTSSVKVSWKKAKDATSYRIYYRPSTTRKWISLTTVSSKTTSYTHKNSRKYPLKAGKKYYYTVRAYNKYSKKWGQYNTTGKAVVIPSVPGTVKISSVKANGTNKVSIRWNKTSNATSYRIYYRPSTTKKWTAVKTVSSKTTSYTYVSSKLKAGKKYYYTVRAYNQNSKKWGKYDTTGKAVTMQKPVHKHSYTTISSIRGDCIHRDTVTKQCSCGATVTETGSYGNHNWQDQYKDVYHDAVYENRPVYENKPVYEERFSCKKCGFNSTDIDTVMNHCMDVCDSTYELRNIQVGTEKIQTGTESVKVKDAWTERVPNGKKCTICGTHQ